MKDSCTGMKSDTGLRSHIARTTQLINPLICGAMWPGVSDGRRARKGRGNRILVRALSLGLVSFLPLSGFAAATAKWWDVNGTTSGCGGTSPSGTWSTSAANWATSSGGTASTAAWVNDPGGAWKARFSAASNGTGAFTVTGSGTIEVAQIGIEEGTPTFTGGAIKFVGSEDTQILTGINGSSQVIINSQISGSVGLIIARASTTSSTTTLGSTANNWTGGLRISQGETLKLGASNVIPNANNVTVYGTLNVNGKSETVNALSGSGTVSLPSGSVIYVNAHTDNPSSTFSGKITGAGQFAKSGTGTLTLSGESDWTGNFEHRNGTVVLDGANRFTGNPTLINGGVTSTLKLGNAAQALGNINNAVVINIDTGGASGILTVGGNNGSGTYKGVMSGAGGLTKTGSGTLTLAGVNTYTGNFTLSAGTVTVNSGAALCGATGSAIVNAGTLNLNNTAQTIASLSGSGGTINLASGHTLTVNQSANTTYSGQLSCPGANPIKKTGTGTLTLSGTADNNSARVEVNGGKVVLAKTSSSSVHALGGACTVNSGTLQLGGTGGDQLWNGSTVTAAPAAGKDAVFDLNGQSEEITSLTLRGSGIDLGGALINSSTTAASTLTCSSGISLTGNTYIGGAGNLALPSVIASGGNVLVKVGTGTLTLSGTAANTASGSYTEVREGELVLAKTAGVNAIAHNVTIGDDSGTDQLTLNNHNQIADSSVLQINGATTGNSGKFNLNGYNETVGGIFSDKTYSVIQHSEAPTAATASTLTVNNSDHCSYAGIIRDKNSGAAATLGLVKTGTAALTLSGNLNSYSGGTTVEAGALLVNNSSGSGTGSGTVTVNGGTLGGNGIISGQVTVNSSGMLAPGATLGILGTLTLGAAPSLGGTAAMQINKAAGPVYTADKVNLTSGVLNYGGTLTVTELAGSQALSGGEVFDLFDAPGFSGSFATINLPPLATQTPALNWYTGNLTVDGTIIVNRAPRGVQDYTLTRAPGTSMKINVATLSAALMAGVVDDDKDSGDEAIYDSLASFTSNRGTVVTESKGRYLYAPNHNCNDYLVYRVKDQRGGVVTAKIHILVEPYYGKVELRHDGGGTVTLSFYGIPGYDYYIQRKCTVEGTWADLYGPLTCTAAGLVTHDDTPGGCNPAFYRLRTAGEVCQ